MLSWGSPRPTPLPFGGGPAPNQLVVNMNFFKPNIRQKAKKNLQALRALLSPLPFGRGTPPPLASHLSLSGYELILIQTFS